MKITFLGTAANGGVPQIDCRCVNCQFDVPIRKRNSILIEIAKKKIIVDCGPDFHSQLIENNLRLNDLSGIVITHLHWDHCSGLFDLSSGKKIGVPIFVHQKIIRELLSNKIFSYIFENGWAKFSKIEGFDIKLIKVDHDPNFPTFATKISTGNKHILIITDIWKINNKLIIEAKKSDLIIFDGTFLKESKHWHMSISESANLLNDVNKNVIFTHINHSEDVKEVIKFLDRFGYRLAFDGMRVKI